MSRSQKNIMNRTYEIDYDGLEKEMLFRIDGFRENNRYFRDERYRDNIAAGDIVLIIDAALHRGRGINEVVKILNILGYKVYKADEGIFTKILKKLKIFGFRIHKRVSRMNKNL